MAKINKLNSSVILEAYSKEFSQKKVVITIGNKNYEVLVDQKFRNTVIQEMFLESLNNHDNYKDLSESIKTSYFMFLLIKYFTDLEIAKTDDFEYQIRLLNALLDLGIYEMLINSFPESEIEKVNEYVIKFSKNIGEFMKDDKNIENLKNIIDGFRIGEDVEVKDVVGEDENIWKVDGDAVDEVVEEIVNKIEITDPE